MTCRCAFGFGGNKMEALKNPSLHITQSDNSEALAKRALELFIEEANKAIAEKSKFCVAVSGGQTPMRFFEMLGESPESQAIDWDKVQLFWVDERCVPPDADASNYGLAANTFLDKVSIPIGNIHRVSGESKDYRAAVDSYDHAIREVFSLEAGEFPQFDLIVLGMGPNGHIGSLFPNSYALFDTDDLVSVVYMTDGDYSRITLTHPVLCAALRLVILVSGSEKSEILKEVLEQEPDEVRYPVHTLWPILDKVTWLIDGDAGRRLR